MRLLITGISGFLGGYLAESAANDFETLGTYLNTAFESDTIKTVQLDLTDENALKETIEMFRPHFVLHAAAAAKPEYCEQQPITTQSINVWAVRSLAIMCRQSNIPLLFVSTDLVFNGQSAPYSIDDMAFPLSVYGSQKFAAEELLLDEFPSAYVCRIPLLYGKPLNTSANFLHHWVEALRNNRTIAAFTDEYRTPIWAKDAANGLLQLVKYIYYKKPKERLYQLSTEELMSRFEIAIAIADTFKFNNKLIQGLRREEANLLASRPQDVSLVQHLPKEIKFKPSQFKNNLKKIRKEYKF